MAVNLNLLPQDLQVSKGLGKALKTTKSLGVILIVLFIFFSLGAVTFFIINKLNLNSIQSNVDKLKTQVKAQETSEQQLVLLKDRLAKISSVKSQPNASKNIDSINSLFVNVSPISSLDNVSVSSTKTDIAVTLLSNEDLMAFMQNLRNSDKFKLIDLYSFDYNQSLGYLVKVSLNNK